MNYKRISKKDCLRTSLTVCAITLSSQFICAEDALGQNVKETHITYVATKVSVSDAFDQLSKLTGFFFFYDESVLSELKNINIHVKDGSIDAILNQLSGQTGLYFKKINNTISVSKQREPLSETALTQQQIKTITGTVNDSQGEPIIGANVVEKGTTNGTVTDVNGQFSLKVSDKAVLLISYLGYNPQELMVGNKNSLSVRLSEDSKMLDEVVVIGYGTIKKENLTGSVASIKSNVFTDRASASPATMLQGVAPGLTVQQNSNYPGGGASIKVREFSSWQKDQQPLFVIDGIQKSSRDFALINPADIENVSVLKDAASSAIYGMKAGNGVILVTTKNGAIGKPRISYSYSYSTRKPTMFPEYMSSHELAQALNETYRVKGLTSASPEWYTDDELEYFKTHTYQNDWKDAVWMNNPTDQVHNLSVSGGSDAYRYYVSGSYLTQEGATNNNYNKYTMLAKIEGKVMEGLDFSLNMNAAWDNKERPYWAYGNDDNLRGLIARAMGSSVPFRPVFINDLPTANLDNTNMGALARGEGGYSKDDSYIFNPTFELKYKIPKVDGLVLKVRGSYYSENGHNKTLGLAPYVYYFKTAGAHNHIITDEIDYRIIDAAQTAGTGSSQRLKTKYSRRNFYQFNAMAEYNKSFGLHTVSAVGGYEQMRSWGDYMDTTVDGFPNLNFPEIDGSLGSSDEKKRWVGGTRNNLWAQASFIGRVDYNYDQKYLLGVTLRADGSYKFPPESRWGFFPAVSAGWNISKESFFEPARDYLEALKLRGSWGITGTDNTDAWQWQQNYNYKNSSGILFNGIVTPLTELAGTVNPGITWEKNMNIGVGLDMAMPENLVSFSADYWYKHTTDILGTRQASIPEEVGAALPAINYGIVSAHGLEFVLAHEKQIGQFHYRVSGNISFSDNKIIEQDQAAAVRDYENRIGTPTAGDLKGYISEGIIRTQADVDRILRENGDNFTIFGVKPQPGMLMYKDMRGPAGVEEPDGKIDDYDQQFISWNAIPRISYGFSLSADWKGFDVSAIISGLARYEGFARGNWFLPNGNYNNQTYWNDMWTPENTDAKLPSGAWQGDVMGVNNVNQNSTFWLQNRSFVRLKNVSLGYTFNVARLQPLKSLRLFVSGENLFEIAAGDWKRYSDPELGDGGAYPILRSFTAGVNVSF